MKKITLFLGLAVAMMFSANTANAQEEGKFRVGMNFGVAIPSGGAGFMFDVEPKYNLNDNMNVGLRFGAAIIVKAVEVDGGGEFESAKASVNSSYLGTFDYYFPLGGSFTPFVGGGIGLFNIASVGFADGDEGSVSGVDASTKFGGMLRGGFEVGKFRMALEYDLIPKTTLQDVEGKEIGTISNGYLGITVGFFVGGGRWG